MTWSIVARDASGAFGVAIASRFFAVGALCPHARAGVGALATQALVNPLYGAPGLEMLARSSSATDVVAKLTTKQAEGVYQVRMELEGLACQLFAEHASEDQRTALNEAFANLKRAFRKPDPLGRLNAKNHFYDCLVEGSGNEALGMSLRMLNARVMLLRATSLRAPGRSSESLAELAELVDALMDRDAKRARKAAVSHVRNAAQAAIALLQNDKSGGSST